MDSALNSICCLSCYKGIPLPPQRRIFVDLPYCWPQRKLDHGEKQRLMARYKDANAVVDTTGTIHEIDGSIGQWRRLLAYYFLSSSGTGARQGQFRKLVFNCRDLSSPEKDGCLEEEAGNGGNISDGSRENSAAFRNRRMKVIRRHLLQLCGNACRRHPSGGYFAANKRDVQPSQKARDQLAGETIGGVTFTLTSLFCAQYLARNCTVYVEDAGCAPTCRRSCSKH